MKSHTDQEVEKVVPFEQIKVEATNIDGYVLMS